MDRILAKVRHRDALRPVLVRSDSSKQFLKLCLDRVRRHLHGGQLAFFHPRITVNMWVILLKLITHILLPDIERTQHTPMPLGRAVTHLGTFRSWRCAPRHDSPVLSP